VFWGLDCPSGATQLGCSEDVSDWLFAVGTYVAYGLALLGLIGTWIWPQRTRVLVIAFALMALNYGVIAFIARLVPSGG
jgi:hypothetical protein